MNTKATNTPQQNRKSIEGRLSLNLPLSSRKNLNSGRLSIPNRKDNAARPSISSIHSRPSLPVNANSSRALELPFKKEYIIENLMKKLEDEQELRSIIESKYLGSDQFSCSGRYSFKSQANTSRCSNCNCSQAKINTLNRPSFQNNQYREKRKSNYLQHKIRDFQQELFLVKQTAAQLSQKMVNTNMDKLNERKSFSNFTKSRTLFIQPETKEQLPNNNRNFIANVNTNSNLNSNANSNGNNNGYDNANANKIEQKQNQNCHKLIQNSFLSNLDSTLSILGNVSVARVR